MGLPPPCIIYQVVLHDRTLSFSVVLGQRGRIRMLAVRTYIPNAIRLVGWQKRVISPSLCDSFEI